MKVQALAAVIIAGGCAAAHVSHASAAAVRTIPVCSESHRARPLEFNRRW